MRAGGRRRGGSHTRRKQWAVDPQQAGRANKPKWPSDHMSRFLSAQVDSVIKSGLMFIKLALLAELTITAS